MNVKIYPNTKIYIVCLVNFAAGNLGFLHQLWCYLVDLIQENCSFFKPQNIESLAFLITKIAQMTNTRFDRIKEQLLEIIKEKFSPKIVTQKFIRILNLIKDISLASIKIIP